MKILLVFAASLLSFPDAGLCSFNLGLGHNNCLLSRLENVPCHYRRPALTRKPGANEMGDYHTRFKGRTCHIIRRGHEVKPTPKTVSNNGAVFYMCSPGMQYTSPANYLNQRLGYYNVNCTAGQLIYFELLEMELEGTKCYDPAVNRWKCMDYIQVRTPNGNIISDNCGTDKSNLDGMLLPFDSIQVIFRSNTRSRFPGYCAAATCFNPGQSNNCQSSRTRKRRASSLSTPKTKCPDNTHENITIPYGHDLVISSTSVRSVISIVNRQTNRIISRKSKLPIRTLYFFNMFGLVQTFQCSQREYERALQYRRRGYFAPTILCNKLQGPGTLYLPESTRTSLACFQNYLRNVSAYIPTSQEKVLISDYHNSLSLLIGKEEPPTLGPSIEGDFDLITRWVPPSFTLPTKSPKSLIQLPEELWLPRLGRAASLQLASRKTDRINKRVLISAVKNDGSCNPIVKLSASMLVKAVEKENAKRITSLRKLVKGHQ